MRRAQIPGNRHLPEWHTLVLNVGTCLMEFFHSRWHRANNVRRWDPMFNEYGGCPDVDR